jgi:hypothetical protein
MLQEGPFEPTQLPNDQGVAWVAILVHRAAVATGAKYFLASNSECNQPLPRIQLQPCGLISVDPPASVTSEARLGYQKSDW